MIFPIGDDQVHGGYFPYVCYAFLALNILVFLFQVSLGTGANAFVLEYGTIPLEIVNGEDYFTLITSMFLHGGWMHLIGNMLFLWVFADNIEATVGSPVFIIFYILGGLAASAAHIFFNTASSIPCVGASGAISAVLGAYLIMFPRSQVKVLVVYFFRSFSVAAIFFLGFWILQQLISGMASINPDTTQAAGVAWWAHIGGFAFGVLGGLFFKKLYPRLEVIRTDLYQS